MEERPEIVRLRRALARVPLTGDLDTDREAIERAVADEFSDMVITQVPIGGPVTAAHEAPDLEARSPVDLTDPPMETTSMTASRWRIGWVMRVLAKLGVPPRNVPIAHAMGGHGTGVLTATLLSIPSVDEDRLAAAWEPIDRRRNERSINMMIAGKLVHLTDFPEFLRAVWGGRGLLIEASTAGDRQALERLIARLP